ncbi:acetyl-CoA synthase subunit gamma, partial [candidate division KSB1 bacterium]|nr:acetyl-CoA synthase subunit gamma [candidate division KSB1 bacterium]
MLETKYLKTTVGKIPLVDSKLSTRDRIGAVSVRCNIRRMDYAIEKGLYAIGIPDANSPVFVSANYKLSFDSLRKELSDLNAWILVLETKGINVWCAAGKGTFGTNELISRLNEAKLEQVVAHKKLIVPQLGAPGIAAHEIREKTGFHIIYGPVQAKHIQEFINNGNKATEEMRTIAFNFGDR